MLSLQQKKMWERVFVITKARERKPRNLKHIRWTKNKDKRALMQDDKILKVFLQIH